MYFVFCGQRKFNLPIKTSPLITQVAKLNMNSLLERDRDLFSIRPNINYSDGKLTNSYNTPTNPSLFKRRVGMSSKVYK